MGDWEALYVNGKIVDQNHEIDRFDLLRAAENYDFDSDDIRCGVINDEDDEIAGDYGSFPEFTSEFKGEY